MSTVVLPLAAFAAIVMVALWSPVQSSPVPCSAVDPGAPTVTVTVTSPVVRSVSRAAVIVTDVLLAFSLAVVVPRLKVMTGRSSSIRSIVAPVTANPSSVPATVMVSVTSEPVSSAGVISNSAVEPLADPAGIVTDAGSVAAKSLPDAWPRVAVPAHVSDTVMSLVLVADPPSAAVTVKSVAESSSRMLAGFADSVTVFTSVSSSTMATVAEFTVVMTVLVVVAANTMVSSLSSKLSSVGSMLTVAEPLVCPAEIVICGSAPSVAS